MIINICIKCSFKAESTAIYRLKEMFYILWKSNFLPRSERAYLVSGELF